MNIRHRPTGKEKKGLLKETEREREKRRKKITVSAQRCFGLGIKDGRNVFHFAERGGIK